jgi:hypothetical protein
VFTLIFQFHPWHALGLGIVTMLLVTGLATMGVDSLLSSTARTPGGGRAPVMSQPVRDSLVPSTGAAQPKAAEKANSDQIKAKP